MAEVARSGEMEQMLSMKVLNSWREDDRNVFIGSIHGSFDPKEAMFAKPWSDLAMRVRVRWARGRGCSDSVSTNPYVFE